MFNYESDHLKSVQLTSTPPLRFVPVSYIIYHQEAILKKNSSISVFNIFNEDAKNEAHIDFFKFTPFYPLFNQFPKS